MKVIAVSGWKRSGKDTISNRLVEVHGYRKMSFAEPLKDYVAKQYNIPIKWMHDQKLKETALENMPIIPKDQFSLNIAKMLYTEFRTIEGQMPSDYHVDASGAFIGIVGRDTHQLYWTPRALLILEGSTKRSVDSDYWSGKLIDNIFLAQVAGIDKFVISDIRYKSEADQLRQAFGKDLTLVRVTRWPHAPSQDSSETDLDNYQFNMVLDNTGTLEELVAKVDELA